MCFSGDRSIENMVGCFIKRMILCGADVDLWFSPTASITLCMKMFILYTYPSRISVQNSFRLFVVMCTSIFWICCQNHVILYTIASKMVHQEELVQCCFKLKYFFYWHCLKSFCHQPIFEQMCTKWTFRQACDPLKKCISSLALLPLP